MATFGVVIIKTMNTMTKQFDAILALFHSLLDEADDEMLMYLNTSHADQIYCSMPSFFIGVMRDALRAKYLYGFESGEEGKLFVFRGVNIIPSSDLAITLYHKDYPYYNRPWMIRKVPLIVTHRKQTEWYDKLVIDLCVPELFNRRESPELN